MSFRRIVLILALLAVAPVLVAGTVLWVFPERVIAGLPGLVQRTTPYTLELRNPVLSWSPLHFSADLVLLRAGDDSSPPLVSVQQPELTMPLLQLLTGSTRRGRFTASNISYYLDEQSTSEPIDLEDLFAPLSRLPGEIEIHSAHLISRSEELWIFPLADIRAQRTRDGALEVRAMASVGARATQLEALADWQAAPDGSHRLDLDATLRDDAAQSQLRLNGVIDADGPALRYRVNLEGRYADVGDFLTALDSDAFPIDGNLRISGTMRGDVNSYTLSIAELSLARDDSYRFTATGTIRQEGAGDATLDIAASGDATQLDALTAIPPALTRVLARSELQLAVAGTLRAPRLSSAALVLHGAGDTRLSLRSNTSNLDLSQLQDLELDERVDADFEFSSRDLRNWLADSTAALPVSDLISVRANGSLSGTRDNVRLDIAALAVTHPGYSLDGTADLRWRESLLSAPALSLTLRERAGPGRLQASGAIADLATLRGLALQLTLEQLRPQPLFAALSQDAPDLPELLSGELLALRAAEPLLLRDVDLTIVPVAGMRWLVTGSGQLHAGVPEADLEIALMDAQDGAWESLITLPRYPASARGQLRLRPAYATLLGNVAVGETLIQAVATTSLEAGAINELALDLYTASLRLEDFAFADAPVAAPEATAPAADNAFAWSQRLPDYPIHLTLRSDGVRGDHSRLEQFSLSLEGSGKRFLLRQFDTRYAGGELIVRGLLDLQTEPPALSLAGQGIRIPLAALIEDLGLQEAVTGLLSVRGGLSTRGSNSQDWQSALQGRLAAAATDTTVSGAAYDLLMSNLLSWLVRGANEKTTTFDCSMAQFDIIDGVARSDSVYIETPRMVATGKARIDLPAAKLDVRIEPRSKARTFQFPSAVRIVGPLDSPDVKVSPLQATADLSAQALLLLPSLTLKLFGIGSDGGSARPCNPGMQ